MWPRYKHMQLNIELLLTKTLIWTRTLMYVPSCNYHLVLDTILLIHDQMDLYFVLYQF